MKINNLLLSKRYKPLGIVLLLLGFVLLILRYQFNYKPDFLNLKVFAFYTYYIESKSFTVVTNQMIEELAAIFMLSGLFLLAFTKEKEESEDLNALRLKAFMVTAYVNLIYLFLSLILFFGFGFVGALTLFMGVWLIVYILVFRYLLLKKKQVNNSHA